MDAGGDVAADVVADEGVEAKQVPKKIISALFLISLLAAGFSAALSAAPKGSHWGSNYFPNFQVTTQDGKTFRFYDDLIKNKKVVINFIYTDCPDICSLTTARLAAIQERMGDLLGREYFFYSISLDPEKDTPEKLKIFAASFSAGPGWLFLTGAPKDLHLIRYKLGERSRSLSEHRNIIMLGNDRTGEWARSSSMANLNLLESHIRELDPKWLTRSPKAQKKARPAQDYTLTGRPGEALFIKACASCHGFGAGDRIGPDLKGVQERRDRQWLIKFMMAPDVMRAKADPIALALDKKFPGVVMPNLSLSKTDVKDLLRYFTHRTHGGSRGRQSAAVKNLDALHGGNHTEHDHAAHNHEKIITPTINIEPHPMNLTP